MTELREVPATTRHVIEIPRWRPASTNELMQSVKARIHLKKRDREMVMFYCWHNRVLKATGKRRVSLAITLGPRDKEPDPDNLWKSLLDALVRCGALRDDKAKWCECGTVTFVRGSGLGTTIILEDL